MLPAVGQQHRGVLHYSTSCNTQSSAHEDRKNNCAKHVELTGIINQPLLLHLVGCLHYLYFITFFRLAKQSQFIPLQNVLYFISLLFLVRKIFTFYIMMYYYLNVHFQGQRVKLYRLTALRIELLHEPLNRSLCKQRHTSSNRRLSLTYTYPQTQHTLQCTSSGLWNRTINLM